MTKKFISLREVARQLNIPPSTVVYYKDRFSEFVPSQGGEGRRKRYPAEVIDIFRRIREMFNNNWSTEQIEQELALRYASGGSVAEARSEKPAEDMDSMVRGMGGVLEKMTDLLENQSLFRSEIRSLRDELAGLKQERQQSEKRYLGALEQMEQEVASLRRAKDELERLLRQGGSGAPVFPSEEYLSRPLVIRTEQGEYLGVLGKVQKHFALRDFVFMIERNAAAGRRMDMSWEKRDDHWVLLVSARDSEDAREQHVVLVTQKTVTPSRNTVTEIVRLNINGNDVPDSLLLSLFKKVKDGFDAWNR
ncbi:MerR family transcriptional regulator [Paucidesulfovibrio longus]|uniref:MerR family transcriptional regulator n=1 Tax=Paucidesulfovibrio longus TaxID=889 RepID=UPI0003B3822C|nr:MerR family transcriptional regulator [Paucidesulfovibrio longus]